MHRKRMVFAQAKPDDDFFAIEIGESSPVSKKRDRKKKKKHTKKNVVSDSDSDSEVEVVGDGSNGSGSSDDSSSEEEIGRTLEGGVVITKRQKSTDVAKKPATPVEVLDDSESDDDVPMMNLDEITSKVPAVVKAREYQAMLLRKRQEIFDQNSAVKNKDKRRPPSPVAVVQKFQFKQSTKATAEELLKKNKKEVAVPVEKIAEPINKTTKIKIKFRLKNEGRREKFTEVSVDPAIPLKDAFAKVCSEIECNRSEVKFEFDGEVIGDGTIPEDEDMEGGEIIDVKY